MTKFIALHETVHRCRPEAPMSKLHNDCGQESVCARRLAANTVGAPQLDLSKYAANLGGATVMCTFFVPLSNAEHHRDPHISKRFGENA